MQNEEEGGEEVAIGSLSGGLDDDSNIIRVIIVWDHGDE